MFDKIKVIAKSIFGIALSVSVAISGPVANAEQPSGVAPLASVATTITSSEWAAYTRSFIKADGRVVDIEKDGHSHSEGQGYGMLLAVRADDRATFDRVLDFTFAQMRGRADGLISWLYNPRAYPRIVDSNNASDGDILIAYALVSAALKWNDSRYVAIALPMIDAIGTILLETRDGMVRLKPGASGFDSGQHGDGAVVNLSYYVYGAFLMFDAIDDRHAWLEAWQSGLMLTEASLAGTERLAPDWISLTNGLAPARGFARKSSYDAVRIPLYMALGGRVPARYFASFDAAWNLNGNRAPKDYDLATGRKLADMNEPGYRAIAAIAACASRRVPLSRRQQRFQVRTYFSSTLHLLALSAVRAHYPHCADPSMAVASAAPRSSRRTTW